MANSKGRPKWFKMFAHQKSLIDAVTDETAGKALKACFQYFDTGEMIELDPMAFAVFMAVKPYIDESFEDYKRASERNKKNIAKRWSLLDTSRNNPIPPVSSGYDWLPSDTEVDVEVEEEKK